MEDTLHRIFASTIEQGQLTVTYPSGRTETYGAGEVPEATLPQSLEAPPLQPVAVTFRDAAAMDRIANDPGLAVGEMYMAGRFTVDEGSMWDFISLTRRNATQKVATRGAILNHMRRSLGHGVRKRAGLRAARRNIAHHYDLDERLFRLFLDPDLNYSCAYFEHDDQSLEDAQRAKQRLITGKLLSKPDAKALDIGCGWGSMGLYLTEVAGLQTTAISISEEQVRVARRRAEERGVADRCDFRLEDYREHKGAYDHITSVGVLDHIGLPQMQTFFDRLSKMLDKQGTAVIHTMARTKPTRYNQPFYEKYIFPGGYIPALSEIIPAVERANLLIKDIEILPLHYAHTCRLWRERFLAQREEVLKLYDERFIRMWEMYLAASEASFRHDRVHVFHIILAKHQDRVPIRRGWLEPELDRLRAAEATRAPIT